MSGNLTKGKNLIKILPVIIFLTGLFFTFSAHIAKAEFLPSLENTLTVIAMGKKYKFRYPEIDRYKGKLYLKNAEEVVDGIYLDTIIKPINAIAKIYPERDYPFEFIKEKNGKCIDKEDLLLKIEKSLLKGGGETYATVKTLYADITVKKLEKSTYRRAFFETNYLYSTDERKENIVLASKYLGGVTILDGEEFSFNERVGERTEKRGFKNAKIIEKGKFTDGIGGGVCQVSSTVYNAVILAGLTVTERHPHSMLVSYLEPSFDAMVSMGYADLKFKNQTGGIVFLVATTKNDIITITVYGIKDCYTYQRVSEVIQTVMPPEPEKIPTPELPKGEEKICVSSKKGAVSKGYLKVFKNGKLIETKLLSSDSYSPLQGSMYVGVGQDVDKNEE